MERRGRLAQFSAIGSENWQPQPVMVSNDHILLRLPRHFICRATPTNH